MLALTLTDLCASILALPAVHRYYPRRPIVGWSVSLWFPSHAK